MQPSIPSTEKSPSLRLWPGVLIVFLMWVGMVVPGWFTENPLAVFIPRMWGPVLAAACLVLWWLFASRIPWSDRVVIIIALAIIGGIAYLAFHKSMNLFTVMLYVLPALVTGWVVWLMLAKFVSWPVRRAGLIVVFLAVWSYFTLIRFDGTWGDFTAQLPWRWATTSEQQYLAEAAGRKKPAAVVAPEKPLSTQSGDWPEFRGPNRDGRYSGAKFETDWAKNPPKLLWKQRVGPGWSSFAVVGNRAYTQEQRDKKEAVVCLDAETGQEIWSHGDEERFEEDIAGPGPRATPTFHDGKIFSLGAAGKLNCLDAATGKLIWSKDIAKDADATKPMWGFSASPLVSNGVVAVFAGGKDNKAVLGYDAATGDLKWSAGKGSHSYCSLQKTKVAGEDQFLVCSDAGLTAYNPADGQMLWHCDKQLEEGYCRVVQPTTLGNDDFLIGTGMGINTWRVHIARDGSGWKSTDVWQSKALKPYYNDVVVHNGHAYGIENGFLTCINLQDGKGTWKERGYGLGQLLLLPDQDLILVLSEKGEVALIEANPKKLVEVCKIPAIEGKTWNHPVIANGKLFVRNGAEAACFQLNEKSRAGGGN